MQPVPAPAARAPTRRERLIAAGREAFGRLPYDEVSISGVAADADVAHGLAFHYFTNKRGFYVEVIRSLAAELRFVHAVPADLPPAAAVRWLTRRHVDYVERHPHILLGPLRHSLGVDPSIRQVFDDARWDGALHVLRLFAVQEPGPVTRLLMHGFMAYQDEILARWLVDRSLDADGVVEVLVAGLRTTLDSIRALEPGAGVATEALATVGGPGRGQPGAGGAT